MTEATLGQIIEGVALLLSVGFNGLLLCTWKLVEGRNKILQETVDALTERNVDLALYISRILHKEGETA